MNDNFFELLLKCIISILFLIMATFYSIVLNDMTLFIVSIVIFIVSTIFVFANYFDNENNEEDSE